MRRKDKALPDAAAMQLLEHAEYGVLSTVDAAGQPYGVPLNYVLLGTCYADSVDQWVRDGMVFHGNLLAIRDIADVEYSGSCEKWFRISEGRGLGRHEEIVVRVGTGHGILYKPLDEWVLPTVDWATR